MAYYGPHMVGYARPFGTYRPRRYVKRRPRASAYKKRRRATTTARRRVTRRRLTKRAKPTVSVPKWTPDEQAFIQTVTNPFGTANTQFGAESKASGLHLGGRVLDESNYLTIPMKLTCYTNWVFDDGAQQGNVLIKVCLPYFDQDRGLTLAHSLSNGLTPTGVAGVDWENWNDVRDVLSGYRVVGCGLKVQFTSTPNNTAGTLSGGNATRAPVEDDGTTIVYATTTDQFEHRHHPLREGMTVRWAPRTSDDFVYRRCANMDQFVNPVITQHNTHEWFGPAIFGHSTNNATAVAVSAVLHIEAYCERKITAFTMTQSPSSPRWPLLFSIASTQDFMPYVTDGNSFKDLFQKGKEFLGKVTKWIMKHGPTVIKGAGTVAGYIT